MSLRLVMAIVVFLWVGMLLGIDFSAVMKFKAPSLTRPVAFDVGRVVFSAFNQVQFVILLVMLASMFVLRLTIVDSILFVVASLALLLQMFWLFPVLSQQVDFILAGSKVAKGYQHQLYGILELIKIIFLFVLGMRLIG